MLTKEQNKVRNWIAKKLEAGVSKSSLTKVLMKRHGQTKNQVHADHPLLKSKVPKIVLVSVVSILVVAAIIFFLVTQVTGPLAGEARSIGLVDLDAPVEADDEEEEEQQQPVADLLDEPQGSCSAYDLLAIHPTDRELRMNLHPSTTTNFNPSDELWFVLHENYRSETQYFVGDFDGNGYDDIMTYPNYHVFFNDDGELDGPTSISTLRNFPDLNDDRLPSEVLVGDVDGDGNDDVVFITEEGGSLSSIYVSLSLGNERFGTPRIVHGNSAIEENFYLGDIFLTGDVDGDGDDDIVIGDVDPNGRASWYVAESNGDGTYDDREYWSLVSGVGDGVHLIGDVDDDGQDDLIMGETTGYSMLWHVSTSNGVDEFNDAELWAENSAHPDGPFYIRNFDDIGGEDLVYSLLDPDPQSYHSEKSWFVTYSEGDGFSRPRRWMDGISTRWDLDRRWQEVPFFVGNFNGNECPESIWEEHIVPRPGSQCDYDLDDSVDVLNGTYVWSYQFPDREKEEYGKAAVPLENGCCADEGMCSRNGQCFDEDVHGGDDLCSDGNWYACDEDSERYVREINGQDYYCVDGEWEICPDSYCSRRSNQNEFKVNQCMDINQPGTYVMFDDIPDHAFRESCIVINGQGVTLDCRGHKITAYEGEGRTGNFVGIDVRSWHDVSVRNCEISGFLHHGIKVRGEGHTFTGNYIYDVGLDGIHVEIGNGDESQVGSHGITNNVFGERQGRNRENHDEGSALEVWRSGGALSIIGNNFHGEGPSTSMRTSIVNNKFESSVTDIGEHHDVDNIVHRETPDGVRLHNISVPSLRIRLGKDLTLIGNRACHYRKLYDTEQDILEARGRFSCGRSTNIRGYDNQFGNVDTLNLSTCDQGWVEREGNDLCCFDNQCSHAGRCLDAGVHNFGRSRQKILCDPAENPLGYDNLVYDATDYELGTAIETSNGEQYFSTGREWRSCDVNSDNCESLHDDESLCPGDYPNTGFETCDGIDNDCDGEIDEVEENPCAEVEEIVQGRFCARIFDYTICPDEIIEGEGAGVNFYPGNAELTPNAQVVNADVIGSAYIQGDSGTVTVQGIPDLTVTLLEYIDGAAASLAVKRTNTNQCIEAVCVDAPGVSQVELTQKNNGGLEVDATPSHEDVELIYDWRKDGESVAILNMPFTKVVSEGNRITGTLDYSHFSVQSALSNAQFVEDGDEDGNGAYRFSAPNHAITIYDSVEFSLRDTFTYAAAIHPTGWGRKVDNSGNPRGYARIMDKKKIVLFLHNEGGVYNERSLVAALRIGNLLYYANTPEDSIELNEWQHVAFSYDSEEGVTMFINGDEQELTYTVWRSGANQPVENFPREIVDDHFLQQLRIGNSENGNRAFQGMIDHVQIFNVPLSSRQMSFLRNGVFDRFAVEELVGDHEWTVEVTPVSNSIDGNSVLSNTLSIDGEVIDEEVEIADTELECGMVIDEDGAEITLDGNLGSLDEPCEGDGITIHASDVVLDCQENTLFGGEQGIGIRVKTNTVVENCIIDGFQTGISGGGVTGPTVRDNTLIKSGLRAIYFESVDESIITENTVRNSERDGIIVLGGRANEVMNNNVQHSPGVAIILSDQEDPTMTDNVGLANSIGFILENTRVSGFNNNIFCRNTELDFQCIGDSRIKGNDNRLSLPGEDNIEKCPNNSPRLGSHYETCVLLGDGEECDPEMDLCEGNLVCGEENICVDGVVVEVDTDEDGVLDADDACPNTPRDENGNPGKVYTNQYPADWRGCLLGDLNHDARICRGDHTSYVTSLDRFFGREIPNNPELDLSFDGSFTRGDHTSYITNLKFFNHGGACAQQ